MSFDIGQYYSEFGGHNGQFFRRNLFFCIGEDSYNEGLSLKRANVVADAWAMGGQIPRSNLTTQGLGKKYPIASNKTAQGRAENRRVAVVITTP